jgi:hypothetical protein
MLGRLRAEGDGDTGIAFEYAIHDAVRTENALVQERVASALGLCRIREATPGRSCSRSRSGARSS